MLMVMGALRFKVLPQRWKDSRDAPSLFKLFSGMVAVLDAKSKRTSGGAETLNAEFIKKCCDLRALPISVAKRPLNGHSVSPEAEALNEFLEIAKQLSEELLVLDHPVTVILLLLVHVLCL